MAEPTAKSMLAQVRLRALQQAADEGCLKALQHGMESYAVATAWLACLFVRTERCIAARSKLTACVLEMDETQVSLPRTVGRKPKKASPHPHLIDHHSLAPLRVHVARVRAAVQHHASIPATLTPPCVAAPNPRRSNGNWRRMAPCWSALSFPSFWRC